MNNNNHRALIINLFGGPGSGKSTAAAYVFSKLKMLGINAELVTEAAKDYIWEESFNNLKDQIYVFGEQQHRILRCASKVDVIITDSPIFLSPFYNNDSDIDENLWKLALDLTKKFPTKNYLMLRTCAYDQVGRKESEAESSELTNKIIDKLNETNQSYITIGANESGYEFLLKDVITAISDTYPHLTPICDLYLKPKCGRCKHKSVCENVLTQLRCVEYGECYSYSLDTSKLN